MRPVTVIPMLLHDKKIRAWAGPGKGTLDMSGSKWIPYRPPTDPSPPSPDYVSAQSAYSMAAASILTAWTGSDKFGYSMTVAPGSSTIEPGRTPAHQVVLEWATFTGAAEEAGMAGLYGGIQFRRDVIVGQRLGRAVAQKVLSKVRSYIDGESPSGSLTSQ
jgi:hypothetical protein